MSMMFCFGVGYCARFLARDLQEADWKIGGTCRNMNKHDEVRGTGISPFLIGNLSVEYKQIAEHITHILISIPPDEEGDIVLRNYLDILQDLPNLKWIGYLSTTGVYGNTDGEWVDETSPLNPPNQRSRNRVLAEQQWRNSGLPVNIFRLAGIYGKGRSAVDNVRANTARRINKEGQVFSRIHVSDVSNIIQSSIKSGTTGQTYNCADDAPAAQEKVVAYAAELLDIEPPELLDIDDAHLSPIANSFYQNNRRVSNDKVKNQLGVKLLYPSYAEGLRSCL